MPSAAHTTLRRDASRAIRADMQAQMMSGSADRLADAVLVVFAERERLLRERIEALPAGLRKGDVRLAGVLAVLDAED